MMVNSSQLNIFVIAAQTSYLHKCGRGITDEEYEAFCYVYSHTYNNLIIGGKAFNNGANFLYSDMSVGRNTYEKNIFYDTEASGDSGALKNNLIWGKSFFSNNPLCMYLFNCFNLI